MMENLVRWKSCRICNSCDIIYFIYKFYKLYILLYNLKSTRLPTHKISIIIKSYTLYVSIILGYLAFCNYTSWGTRRCPG